MYKQSIYKAVSRIKPGKICDLLREFGILTLEDWFCLKASLLE